MKVSNAVLSAALCALGACASSPLPTEQAEVVLASNFAAATPDGTSLVIKRDSGGALGLRGCSYELFLDGKQFAILRYGQLVRAFPPAGPHVMSMKIPGFPCDSGDVEIAIDLVQGKQSAYRITTDPTGKALLQPSAF
jgi:hypothetical protein